MHNAHFFSFFVESVVKYPDSSLSHTHTDHGRVCGLVSSTDQRPPSVWTPEDGVLCEQFAGRAGAERLHRRAGAAGRLSGVLLRRSVQSHQDAAQGRVGASCRTKPAGLNIHTETSTTQSGLRLNV